MLPRYNHVRYHRMQKTVVYIAKLTRPYIVILDQSVDQSSSAIELMALQRKIDVDLHLIHVPTDSSMEFRRSGLCLQSFVNDDQG